VSGQGVASRRAHEAFVDVVATATRIVVERAFCDRPRRRVQSASSAMSARAPSSPVTRSTLHRPTDREDGRLITGFCALQASPSFGPSTNMTLGRPLSIREIAEWLRLPGARWRRSDTSDSASSPRSSSTRHADRASLDSPGAELSRGYRDLTRRRGDGVRL